MSSDDPAVTAYVEGVSPELRPLFDRVLASLVAGYPDADLVLSYDMPTWTLSGSSLVHLAAWKKHLSLYPAPELDEDLARTLAANVAGRGTLQFPLSQPMPLEAIERVVRLLVEQRVAPEA